MWNSSETKQKQTKKSLKNSKPQNFCDFGNQKAGEERKKDLS